MRMLTVRELAHVAAMLSVLVVGVRCAGEPEGEESEHAHLTLEGGLLVAERGALEVCVEVAPTLQGQGEALLGALRGDLAALEDGHPDWEKARYGQAPVKVRLGCPGGAMPSGRLEAKGARVGPGTSAHPSPFRTFVYVLDDAKADEVLGGQQAARARAESLKVGDHLVVEVSTALVVRASALGTSSFREEWLPTGLGLRPLSAASEPGTADFMPKSYDASGVAK
ncbi:hypothetical protein ACN28E_35715 [Archangium lansingense]|uniref:hypothetical protein n=1 Tax=Archangium lansingense TaxID=2995310 RepID=UPI003B7C6CC2